MTEAIKHLVKYYIVKYLGSKKPWQIWRVMINSPKFYPLTYLFYLGSLLYKYLIRQSLLHQTYVFWAPTCQTFLLPKFFTIW